MNNYESALADLIIKKLPNNTPIRLQSFLSNILRDEVSNYDEDILNGMGNLILGYKYHAAVRFLVENEYLDVVNEIMPTHKLNPKGNQAKKLGGVLAYENWEQNQERQKRIEEFPKKKWYIYDPIKTVIPYIITFIGGVIAAQTCNHYKNQEHQNPKTIKSSPNKSNTLNKANTL